MIVEKLSELFGNNINREKEIYIWGAWNRGISIENALHTMGYSISGYIDSNKKGEYNKLPIIPIHDLQGRQDILIIMSIIYHKSVEETLDNLGLCEGRDYVYLCKSEPNNMGVVDKTSDAFIAIPITNIKEKIVASFFSRIEISEGTTVGANSHIKADEESEIIIGKKVKIGNNVSITCSKQSRLIVSDNVVIEDNVSIIVKDGSVCRYEENVKMASYTYTESSGKSEIILRKGSLFCTYGRMYARLGGKLEIGERSRLGQYIDIRAVNKTSFHCGKDCLFSYRIRCRSHNGHTLIDLANKEVYKTKENVNIADHVWIGTGSLIMPGTCIGKNSIVGANSFVNKKFGSCVLITGTPARVYRENMAWDIREMLTYDEWEADCGSEYFNSEIE